MAKHHEVAARWLDIALGKTTKRPLRSRNMFTGENRIFSYGTHFELGRVLLDRRRRPISILLNGDNFSNTTSGHQSVVRNVVARSGMPSVIIPFSALDSAGIDRASVEIVHVLADRNEVTKHNSTSPPPAAVWVTVEDTEYQEYPSEVLEAKVAARNAELVRSWEHRRDWAQDKPDSYWGGWLLEHPTPPEPSFTLDDLDYHQRHHWVVTGTHQGLKVSNRKYADTVTVTPQEDGSTLYTWETRRHWLGESLVRAKTTWTTRITCKTCSGTGGNPDRSDDTKRYDDDFFCPTCAGRGGRTKSHSRTSFYLSGFDHQEARPLYFFCELPKGAAPTTVAEAYEALKPTAVKLADEAGREYTRQGDIFGIPVVSVDTRQLRLMGARFEKRGPLLNTNHVATEVAYLPDGTTLARGVLYHAPEWRQPDHARRRLNPGWNVVVKNTVPLAA